MNNISYREQLLAPQWIEKRIEIFKLDKFKCQMCDNEELDRNLIEGEISRFNSSEDIINLIAGITERIPNPDETIHYEVEFKKINSENILGCSIKTKEFLNKEIRNKKKLKITFIEYPPNENNYIHYVFAKIFNHENVFWENQEFYHNNLHLHHRYYQKGKYAWDYPNDALQTLCWICHKRFHEHNDVPCLNENGNEIAKLTTCNRCYGVGRFPEFEHIEHGICFRCRGARYEQLILHRI